MKPVKHAESTGSDPGRGKRRKLLLIGSVLIGWLLISFLSPVGNAMGNDLNDEISADDGIGTKNSLSHKPNTSYLRQRAKSKAQMDIDSKIGGTFTDRRDIGINSVIVKPGSVVTGPVIIIDEGGFRDVNSIILGR